MGYSNLFGVLMITVVISPFIILSIDGLSADKLLLIRSSYQKPVTDPDDYHNLHNVQLKPLLDVGSDTPVCGNENNLQKGNFTPYDYSLVIAMLVISLGIGIFYGYFDKHKGGSSTDFLLGTQMTVFPVTLSLSTSFITAIELLGNPAEMFFNGTQFALIVISIVLVIPIALKVFYPIYFKMQLTSCYEYLGIRFGKELRILGALLYVVQMSFYTAVAVLAPAIALSKATGLNTHIAVILIYIVCISYASQGGIKAVVIADTFQACILAISMIVILGLGSYYTGTLPEIFETANKWNRIELLNFDPNPTTRHSVFSVVIGGFFYWTSMFCTNQVCVQKCMSLKCIKLARKALVFAILGLIVVFLMNFYAGLLVFHEYAACDPLKSGAITAQDQLLPFYVMDIFKNITFISGLFVAGIFAASLGTVASALTSQSAVTCEDLLVSGLNIKISPEKGALYAKWMSLGYGLLSFSLVFVVERLGGILQATLTLNGLIGGVTLGLFSLGIFFKKANRTGALYGGILSLMLVVYIGVMSQLKQTTGINDYLPSSVEKCSCHMNETITDNLITDNDIESSISPLYRISYMYYSLMGAVLTIIFGIIISIITDAIAKYRILKITSAVVTVNKDDKNCFDGVVIDENNKRMKKLSLNTINLTMKQTNRPQLPHSLMGIDNIAMNLNDNDIHIK